MRKNVLILGHNDATHFIDINNQYARMFDREHYHVTVAYLTGEENPESRRRTLADEVLFLGFSKKAVRGFKIGAIQTLLKLTREKNFELVICHRYKPIYIMMWVASFHKIPAMIFVMHELRTMQAFGRKALASALWRKNMVFAGVSDAVRDDLRASLTRIPKENIVTLYNVIDTELTEPHLLTREKARETLNLNADDFVIGNIARLARNKDHATLIHAFSLIKPYCPNAKLLIMGVGDLKEALQEQIASYHLQNDVILAGFVPHAVNYIKAFDVFALSSIQEAFGRVLIEAMLAKCPIIATTVNGIPEVMRDTGMLVKPKDAMGLAAAIQHYYKMTPEERSRSGEEGYQHVHANYSLTAFHQQLWALPILCG
jgi:glycosyltransferase involved in cell wall biosynthesis